MKRTLIFLSLLLPFISCAQSQENLSERALELCQYIPDHGLKPEAKDYMTPEFFRAVAEAFDAPVVDYGEIGDNEWLWYFVTGNGGGEPVYGVKSVTRTSKDEAKATITVRETWEGEFIDSEEDAREYEIALKRIDGQWLLDDFDGKKAECLAYIQEMRGKYKSGELLKYMQSEEYFHEYIPDFKKRVEDFFKKYGD